MAYPMVLLCQSVISQMTRYYRIINPYRGKGPRPLEGNTTWLSK